jgi:hypothetical protein
LAKFIQRYALWHAYDARCVYCGEPMLFNDMTHDHILPKILNKELEQKNKVLSEYGLDDTFVIESYDNWIPCHFRCNRQKGDTIYNKPSTIHLLGIAAAHSEKAIKIEDGFKTAKRFDNILFGLASMVEEGIINLEFIIQFLKEQKSRDADQIVIAFSLMFNEVLESGLLPDNAPKDYSGLCDWLEKDLESILTRLISNKFYTCETSDDGESFSVRVAFVNLNVNEINKFSSDWWEILEVEWYSEIYEDYPTTK